MGRQRSASTSCIDEEKSFLSKSKKEQAVYLKGHHLLQTCSKDQREKLPKVGELVWARVLGSVFWPGFILELKDVELNVQGADDIDDTAYGFVMFLEKTYRYAPVAWDQMIPFKDMKTQMFLMPHFNKLVVKKSWKPTSVYKWSLKMAILYSEMSLSDRLVHSISSYKQVKTVRSPIKAQSAPTTPAAASTPLKEELRPEEAISKVMSAVREKKKSGIRVSERITKKQIVKLKPKPAPKSTANKKTDKSSDDKAAPDNSKVSKKVTRNQRPEIGGEVLKEWTRDRFKAFPKQYAYESSNVQCGECGLEISAEDQTTKTCHGYPYHSGCLIQHGEDSPTLKCKMCINRACFLCKKSSEKTHKCSRCELRFHIDCLLKDWPQAEIQGSNGPITCPLHFCHTCLGEQKIYGKFRDYTASSSRSYKCKLCLSNYHKTCLPAGCGESLQGKEFIICPKHTLPELKVHQRRIGCLGCYKSLKPKEEKVECSFCIQAFHPECVGYTGEIREKVTLDVFGQGYKCYSCRWGLFPLYGQVVWFQQPQSQYWPARILFPAEQKHRKNAKRLLGQYSVEYFGTTSYYDNASRALPLHLTTVEIFKAMKVYQEVPKILRAHEEAAFCFMFSDEYRDKQLPPPKPVYKKIEKNVYRTVTVQKVREPTDVCSCSEEKTDLVCQADSGCTNRDMEMECSDRICKGGSRCCNRMFSERKNDEEFLEQKLFPNKGWGIVAKKSFKAGDFVAEYRGELIDANEMKWRLSKKEEEDPMYIMEISKLFYIDAEYVGNMARLINHSCDPNCDVRKYLSMGRSVGGIFARRAIEAGEEVTFRYGCGSQSTAPFRCRCGARNCTVFVGKDVPENYSVEEDPEQSQDKWDDVCSKCGFGGRVICCEFPGCGKVWHYQCIGVLRKPRKNWCCPEHPARRVAQLKKASEARSKANKSRSASSTPNGSTKTSAATPQQQTKKKIPRQSFPSPVETVVVTEEEKPEIVDITKELAATPSISQKRKRSSTNSSTETTPCAPPAEKKQRIGSSTTNESDDPAQVSQEQPITANSTPVNNSGRNLRSSKIMSPPSDRVLYLEAPTSPTFSMKSKALLVLAIRNAFEVATPVNLPDGRRRRATSIPATSSSSEISLTSTPNTRSKRSRRGESVNERCILPKKFEELNYHLPSSASSLTNGFIWSPKMGDLELPSSDEDPPKMSRRRSRNHKPTEPFSPLVLNPNVPPRDPPPVVLSDTLNSNDNKHGRIGTRSTSRSNTFVDSPSYNHMNGQDYTQTELFSKDLSASGSITLSELKKEPLGTGYEEDSYLLESSLEQTRSRKLRAGYEADTESCVSANGGATVVFFDADREDSALEPVRKTTKPLPRQYPGDIFSRYK